MIAFLPLLVISVVVSGAMYWTVDGFPWLAHLTYHALDFCEGIFAQCFAYTSVMKLILLWSGAAILATGFLYSIIRAAAVLAKTRKAIRRLPLSRRCGHVVLIRDEWSRAAFTHGLLRPTIYLSTGLLANLDRDEIKAVFLHELHHKRRLDPLRFFLLSIFRDMFFYIPLIKYLVNYLRFKKEQEADDAARATASESLSLAGALLKVAAFQNEMAMMPASITGGTERGAVAARIRRLVEGKEVGFSLPAARSIAASLFVTVFIALSLAMPLNAGFSGLKDCIKAHCTMHSKKAAATNCKMMSKA